MALITLCVPCVCLALLFIPSSQVVFTLFLSLITLFQSEHSHGCNLLQREGQVLWRRKKHGGEHDIQPPWAPQPVGVGSPEPGQGAPCTPAESSMCAPCTKTHRQTTALCELDRLPGKHSETSTGNQDFWLSFSSFPAGPPSASLYFMAGTKVRSHKAYLGLTHDGNKSGLIRILCRWNWQLMAAFICLFFFFFLFIR